MTRSPKPSFVAEMLAMVAPAETAFRSRWRMSTLERIDPDLYQALVEQIGLYDTAMVTGSDAEARMQAEAMVRGWRAACARLEAPLQDDDAYFVGWAPIAGIRVVIGEHRASMARVQVKDGVKLFFLTPDEVAHMFVGTRLLADAKSLFPDAEILEVVPPKTAAFLDDQAA